MKKNGDIIGLIRPAVRKFEPYVSARHASTHGDILLDANENSLGSAAEFDGLQLNRYPDPNQVLLREELSRYLGIRADSIFAGSGSDEIIDLVIRLFCNPGEDEIIIVEPTYGMYRISAELNGVGVRSCSLSTAFEIDAESVAAALNPKTKLVFCCSPNNPTGNLLDISELVKICTDARVAVVVDEAYIEFAGGTSLCNLVRENPYLVALRTFSKAWGLAGIRLGYCAADPKIVSHLYKIKAPYNINMLSSEFAIRALRNRKKMETFVRKVISARNRLREKLERIPHVEEIYPSDANFLLVKFSNSRRALENLRKEGISVRDRSSSPILEGCIRITVGTEEENDAVITALRGM